MERGEEGLETKDVTSAGFDGFLTAAFDLTEERDSSRSRVYIHIMGGKKAPSNIRLRERVIPIREMSLRWIESERDVKFVGPESKDQKEDAIANNISECLRIREGWRLVALLRSPLSSLSILYFFVVPIEKI